MAAVQRLAAIIPFTMLAACGSDPAAHADTTNADSSLVQTVGVSERDSAAGYVVDTGQERARRDSSRDRTRPDSARGDSAADSTKRSDISVTMAPGRPKRDSLALVYAIQAYERTSGWPVRGPAPAAGAILPNKRIIAYYGNPLSKRMGILGEIPPDQMLARLENVAAEWEAADPGTPVQPALHLVSVVAQGGAGKDGKYRLRMDSSLIEEVYGWARQKNALLFVDIQAGFATIQEELPRLMKFLERPDVHLGLDPEFYMHHDKAGVPPGKKIGTLTAAEINYAIGELSRLVREKGLPPKVLVIHRFTRPMVRGYSQIRLDPNVQVVLNMDGWGAPWLKFDSYKDYVVSEPVQFTGFKIFYRNDTKKGDPILTPGELLQLKPRPIYVQYQ